MNPEGETVGTITFEAGKIGNCRAGTRRGEEAVYQLFETPVPGTFIMKSRREGPPDEEPEGEPREVLPIVLEAMRRHDEFRQALALVPDDASLKPTGSKPTRPPDESDQNFLRAVWAKAAAGGTAGQLEQGAAVDSYRIRRLLAHWGEEGALQLAS